MGRSRDRGQRNVPPLGSRARLLRDSLQIEARHTELLHERSGGVSPHPIVFSRPPGGAPYVGKWTDAHRTLYERAIRQRGLVNVLWHRGTGDHLPEARGDVRRMVGALTFAARQGGVTLIHDAIITDALRIVFERIASDPALVVQPLEDFVKTERCGGGPAES